MDVAVEISGGGSAKQADECVKALVQAVDGLDMEDVLDDPMARFVAQDVMWQVVPVCELAIDRVAVRTEHHIRCELMIERLEKVAATPAGDPLGADPAGPVGHGQDRHLVT